VKRGTIGIAIYLTISAMFALSGYCQQSPQPVPTNSQSLQDLAKEVLNPFAGSIKVPIQFTGGFGVGPRRNFGESLNVEPAIPFSLTSDWDLIVRPNVNLTYAPNPNAQFGLQDFQTSLFLTPSKTSDWIWGIGPIFQVPSATSDRLGSGRWSAGPTAALVYSEGPWFNAILTYQLMSFAGNRSRGSVNQTYIETLISYNFESGWTVQCDPQMTFDWTADSANGWTIPMGADIGKTFQVGGRTISWQVGAYDYLKYPDGAPEWIVRAQVTFLFPPPDRW
jgi:hypothetical protein